MRCDQDLPGDRGEDRGGKVADRLGKVAYLDRRIKMEEQAIETGGGFKA
jgi:hypothetical protein